MDRSACTAALRIEPRFPGDRLVGGKYNLATHTVFLYKEDILIQCGRLFGSTDRAEEYIAVILAHELGHAQDGQLRELADSLDLPISEAEKAHIRLRIEENAWAYAEALLPEADAAFLGTIIEHSLAAYRSVIADVA
ncbi:hypothetical protein [Gorillibacterium sp. sgz500922]|uniref:hypothetical protein n=1 Tax=Gorillibacterium sp. sgz500922 TaxID=3446694 RepID=UPI003F66B11E